MYFTFRLKLQAYNQRYVYLCSAYTLIGNFLYPSITESLYYL